MSTHHSLCLSVLEKKNQACRNTTDLLHCNLKPKYRTMNSFYKYYSGELTAPCLTLFIGGNHEASNHLKELYFGGWVAPNIYYLGASGVVQFAGLRIAGVSGIYDNRNHRQGESVCVCVCVCVLIRHSQCSIVNSDIEKVFQLVIILKHS